MSQFNNINSKVNCFTHAVIFHIPGYIHIRAVFYSVTYKAPAIDTDSRTFKIKVLIPKTVPLVSGMLCELRIVLLERENYGLPEDAVLLRAGGRRIVYTVNAKNRAESVDVTTGLTDGGWCEIADGEKLTDRKVIVSGQTFVNNGSLLTVVSDGEKK